MPSLTSPSRAESPPFNLNPNSTTLSLTGLQMAPQVLHRVLHSTTTPTPAQSASLTIRPALLKGYTRHKVVACDYPAIIPDQSAPALTTVSHGKKEEDEEGCVRGTCVQGLTDIDIWRLDIFEGDQYERRWVRCCVIDDSGERIESGESVDVETYVWIEDPAMLEPQEWDFDEFRREKIKRWIGMEQYEGELRPSIRGGCLVFFHSFFSFLILLFGSHLGSVDGASVLAF